MSAFPETLFRVRIAHRVSQSVLAELAGLDHSHVSRLEAGERHPSRNCVDRIVAALRVAAGDRYALLTSAGFAADLAIEDDLVTLNAFLADSTIDPAYRNAMRGTIRSLLVLANQNGGSDANQNAGAR